MRTVRLELAIFLFSMSAVVELKIRQKFGGCRKIRTWQRVNSQGKIPNIRQQILVSSSIICNEKSRLYSSLAHILPEGKS